MIKAIGAVLMSVMLLVFLSGCGQSDQPAKPAPPAKAEHPTAAAGEAGATRGGTSEAGAPHGGTSEAGAPEVGAPEVRFVLLPTP